MTLEEALANDLGQQMANAMDGNFLVEIAYYDHKKLYGPTDWRITQDKIKPWVEEIMPDCLYHNNILYYKDEADAIMFRLKWI
jgi:hypothetical protein